MKAIPKLPEIRLHASVQSQIRTACTNLSISTSVFVDAVISGASGPGVLSTQASGHEGSAPFRALLRPQRCHNVRADIGDGRTLGIAADFVLLHDLQLDHLLVRVERERLVAHIKHGTLGGPARRDVAVIAAHCCEV